MSGASFGDARHWGGRDPEGRSGERSGALDSFAAFVFLSLGVERRKFPHSLAGDLIRERPVKETWHGIVIEKDVMSLVWQ